MNGDFGWAFSFSLLWWCFIYSMCGLASIGAALPERDGRRMTPAEVQAMNRAVKGTAFWLWSAGVIGYFIHVLVLMVR